MGVRLTIIHVVINDGLPILCKFEQIGDFLPQDRINRIIGADDDNVILIYDWGNEIQPVGRVVFIEEIIRILLLVQEGEGQRTFSSTRTDIFRVYVVLLQVILDYVAYSVSADFTDENRFQTDSSQ